MSTPADAASVTEQRLPSLARVWRVRAVVEVKEFFRQREAVVFTLLFPVILLLVFGAVLDYEIGSGVSFTQYFMAGVIAAGILGAGLQNMAISIATERSDGTRTSPSWRSVNCIVPSFRLRGGSDRRSRQTRRDSR